MEYSRASRSNAKPPKVLCVIPAKGNSRRLPKKNIKILAGKPLVAWTIEAAQEAKRLTDYLVSSDDLEIIEIAKKYGAPAPFVRPAELATDTVRNIAVVRHALEFMENERQMTYDIIINLQPTSPVRDPAHIDQAVEMLWASDLDSLVSVKGPYKKRDPVLKAIRNNVLEDYCSVDDPTDTEPAYMYNAALYAVKRDYFIKHDKLISPRQVPLIMDTTYSVDVDTEADFLVAETYLNFLARRSARSAREKENSNLDQQKLRHREKGDK
jgi:CMP-N-acetylneuraminic acid synthetase